MKRIISLFSPRRPWLFILLIAVGGILALAGELTGADRYFPDGLLPAAEVVPEEIRDIAVSPEGLTAVDEMSEDNPLLYCIDSSRKMRYMLGYKALLGYCGAESRMHIVFGEGGTLYLHYVTWSADGSVIVSEGVLGISPDGKSFEKLCGFDYADDDAPPVRAPRLSAFGFYEGCLRFAHTDPRRTELYSLDVRTGTQTRLAVYEPDENGRVGRVFSLGSRFMLIWSGGRVAVCAPGEAPDETVYTCRTAPDSAADNEVILNAAEAGGRIYVTKSCRPEAVFELKNGSLEQVTDLHELYGNLAEGSAYTNYGLEITKLGSDGGRLIIGTKNAAFAWSDGQREIIPVKCRMPAANIAAGVLPFAAACFFILSGASFIVFLIFVKKSILIKQLMITIPATAAAVAVFFVIAQKNLTNVYLNDCVNEMTAICELCSADIDADSITGDPAAAERSREQLMGFTRRNRGYWSRRYDLRICVPEKGGNAFVYADSSDEELPCTELDEGYSPEELERGYLPDSKVCFFAYERKHSFTARLLSLTKSYRYQAITPLYSSDGQYRGYLSVENDTFSFSDAQDRVRLDLLKALIPCALALAAAVTSVSVYISVVIKRATATVTKIAEGDFSARVDSRAKDELGEICRSVNSMASSLDAMFREKDENEKFYYKFVPEKFRELLGREKITDLALGDAESLELTVLFCDIRSFSINSEIMNAKENFEFVNVIYGKAGPLVRKYGGFVDKYIGDAVMALFESPDSAVACGIELYRDIVLDPSTAQTLGISELNIGIGIHTGMARIGIVGESERLSGTVISDTVNLSSRLESLTKQFHTAMLISKDTLDRMTSPDSLELRYLGMLQVAGVNEVKGVYEVLDCLEGSLRELRSGCRAEFREAVRLFHLGKRAEAAGALKKIIDEGKADDTVRMYLGYINGLSEEDKGNVFRFVRK